MQFGTMDVSVFTVISNDFCSVAYYGCYCTLGYLGGRFFRDTKCIRKMASYIHDSRQMINLVHNEQILWDPTRNGRGGQIE